MWIPRSLNELVFALPGITETSHLELKEQLPITARNGDLAKDVASLTSDGGVIIYGVREDRSTQSFSLAPIDLTGVRERVASIVGSRVEGSPYIETLTIDDETGSGKGFLVVHVPESPMAPHMVDGIGFFGRFDTVTRMLTAGDIDRLYQRRAKWDEDRSVFVSEAITDSQLTSKVNLLPGVVYVVAHPVTGQSDIRVRSGIANDHNSLMNLLTNVCNALQFVNSAGVTLSAIIPYEFKRTLDGVELVRPDSISSNSYGHAQFLDDGTVRLSYGPIVDNFTDPSNPMVRDGSSVQVAAQAFLLAGNILAAAGYSGLVDVAIQLSGCDGTFSIEWQRLSVRSASVLGRIPEGNRPLTARVAASDLNIDQVCDTTRLVAGRLLEVLRPAAASDPLIRRT
ncbi:MAG TPA: ATP-binding protein [Acidimicrobiales bacterium]